MPLITQLQTFATECVATPHGAVQFRRACSHRFSGPVSHVLLHGIGSASANWLAQLLQARDGANAACHVLAWDAPGYGASAPLMVKSPTAADYAARMWEWLDAAGVQRGAPFVLVGHSLGALMAASAAVLAPERVAQMFLLAPAHGYARSPAALREQKLSERLDSLALLGPAGMASRRAGTMLSANASAAQLAFVEHVMAGINPLGYTQAARMLAGGDVMADLAQRPCPVVIASGSADTVTPQHGCQAMAQAIGAPYVSLGEVGHSCALEAAVPVNNLIGLAEGQLGAQSAEQGSVSCER